jgi:hypothetical protein
VKAGSNFRADTAAPAIHAAEEALAEIYGVGADGSSRSARRVDPARRLAAEGVARGIRRAWGAQDTEHAHPRVR